MGNVIKKYVLVQFNTEYDNEGVPIITLKQADDIGGYYDSRYYKNSAFGKEFDTEDEAVEFMVRENLTGEWLCVPMFRVDYWGE